AAQKLVLALRPRLDALQPARDGEIDGLIVAGLEMHERHILKRTPIAPEDHLAPEQVQRSRDITPVTARKDEKHLLAHRLSKQAEEFAREIRPPTFAPARIHVERKEPIQWASVISVPVSQSNSIPASRT